MPVRLVDMMHWLANRAEATQQALVHHALLALHLPLADQLLLLRLVREGGGEE